MSNFSEFNLPRGLADALESIGFVSPTPIQEKSIPVLLSGKDLVACAQTGSGKTGAYLIPMVKALMENPKSQGMVLVPTRELAQQVSDFLKKIAPNTKAFHTVRLIGGQDIRKQFQALQRVPRVIVATPGRLIDHLKRNTIQIHKVNHLILDEGDRMIDMGFAPQLEQILKFLPRERQTALFSATLEKKVQQLSLKYLVKPEELILNDAKPVSTIKQSVIRVELKNKNDRILDELNKRKGSVIVFLKTKRRTDQLKKYLAEYGFAVDMLHGGCSQGNRNKAISAFKRGDTRILCATDVAARGIDVPEIEHVINYDLPMQDEDYVHRVGRTARNGAEGEAVSFVTSQELRSWNRLVKRYDIPGAYINVENREKDSSKKKPYKFKPRKHGGKNKKYAGRRP